MNYFKSLILGLGFVALSSLSIAAADRATKEEAKAMPRVAKHFDDIDADKDGTVSKDEIHTFMKEHHKDKGKGMHTEMHKDMHGKDGHDMPMGEKK